MPTPAWHGCAHDLDSGRWAERHGDLLDLDSLDMGYRIVRCDDRPPPNHPRLQALGCGRAPGARY